MAIEDYGLLGDTRTAALVGSDGSVDWLCVPRFDGQPVFGRLVGGADAGSFRLGPGGPVEVVLAATVRDSATLETTWQTGTGRLTLTEGMVAEVGGRLLPATMLVRRLTAPTARSRPSSTSTRASESSADHRGSSTDRAPWSAAGRPWPWRCAPPTYGPAGGTSAP